MINSLKYQYSKSLYSEAILSILDKNCWTKKRIAKNRFFLLNIINVTWYYLFDMLSLIAIIILVLTLVSADADIYRFSDADGTIVFTNRPTDKSAKVVFRESKTSLTAKNITSRPSVARNQSFDALVVKKATEYNLDPELVKAVIKAESNWNPYAVSPKGARGLMQLMPSTANDLGVYNSFDPEENIDGGIRYLRYLLGKFNGDLSLALAAYNAGPARVEKTQSIPAIPETVQYVKRVMSLYSGLPSFYSGYSGNLFAGKKEITRIKKIELEDGTILFTNSKIIY